MTPIVLDFDPESTNQTMSVTASPYGQQLSVRMELKYIEYSDMWYLSCYDMETDKPYFTYIPLISCSEDYPINLVGQFSYKNIGIIVCIPVVTSPSSENPGKDNLSEFSVMWGDGLG